MSKERLEEIKEAIANELGLSEQHLDGTYLYYLTRTKSAFSVGTVTLDDFEEIDGELLEDIFNAIKPFFIEEAERVEVLEKREEVRKLGAEANFKYYRKIEQQNKRYERTLRKTKQRLLRLPWFKGVDAHVTISDITKALEGEE